MSDYSDDITKHYEWKHIKVATVTCHDPEESCPICLYPYVAPQILQCGHLFCAACYFYCPVCNQSINNPPVIVHLSFKPDYSILDPPIEQRIEFTLCSTIVTQNDKKESIPFIDENPWTRITVLKPKVYEQIKQIAMKNLHESKLDSERLDASFIDQALKSYVNILIPDQNVSLKRRIGKVRRFYQVRDGQNFFLSPLNFKAIQQNMKELPQTVKGTIKSVTSVKVDEEVHHRMKFLRHIALDTIIYFVDIVDVKCE